MIGTMSPEEIEATLRRQRVGRLACSADDRPYILPIDYSYDGSCVYSYSMLGRKISVMRAQPRICFQVDEIAGPANWRCVVADGVYEEVTDEGERREVLDRLVPRNGRPVPRSPDAGGRLVVFRLRLTEKSGRFERQDA
jgi:nitroimidazol reductase NimA-like FMN-containing flavoprotein (pyridoxamine 5'-phosphate oxidase superfamily)